MKKCNRIICHFVEEAIWYCTLSVIAARVQKTAYCNTIIKGAWIYYNYCEYITTWQWITLVTINWVSNAFLTSERRPEMIWSNLTFRQKFITSNMCLSDILYWDYALQTQILRVTQCGYGMHCKTNMPCNEHFNQNNQA